jgi:hypothetical protein
MTYFGRHPIWEITPVSRIPDFFSLHEVRKPSDQRVFHNNSACGKGKAMPVDERRSGTAAIGYARIAWNKTPQTRIVERSTPR